MASEVEVRVTCEVDNRWFVINCCRVVHVDAVVIRQLVHDLDVQHAGVALVTIDTVQGQLKTTV